MTLFSADQSVVIPDTVRAFPLYSAAVIDPCAAMVQVTVVSGNKSEIDGQRKGQMKSMCI